MPLFPITFSNFNRQLSQSVQSVKSAVLEASEVLVEQIASTSELANGLQSTANLVKETVNPSRKHSAKLSEKGHYPPAELALNIRNSKLKVPFQPQFVDSTTLLSEKQENPLIKFSLEKLKAPQEAQLAQGVQFLKTLPQLSLNDPNVFTKKFTQALENLFPCFLEPHGFDPVEEKHFLKTQLPPFSDYEKSLFILVFKTCFQKLPYEELITVFNALGNILATSGINESIQNLNIKIHLIAHDCVLEAIEVNNVAAKEIAKEEARLRSITAYRDRKATAAVRSKKEEQTLVARQSEQQVKALETRKQQALALERDKQEATLRNDLKVKADEYKERLTDAFSKKLKKDTAILIAKYIISFPDETNVAFPRDFFNCLFFIDSELLYSLISSWAGDLEKYQKETYKLYQEEKKYGLEFFRMKVSNLYQSSRKRIEKLQQHVEQHQLLKNLEAQVNKKIENFKKESSNLLNPSLENKNSTEAYKENVQTNFIQLKTDLRALWTASAALHFSFYTDNAAPKSNDFSEKLAAQWKEDSIYSRIKASFARQASSNSIAPASPASDLPLSTLSQFIYSEIRRILPDPKSNSAALKDYQKILLALPHRDREILYPNAPLLFRAWQAIRHLIKMSYIIFADAVSAPLKVIFAYLKHADKIASNSPTSEIAHSDLGSTDSVIEVFIQKHLVPFYKNMAKGKIDDAIQSLYSLDLAQKKLDNYLYKKYPSVETEDYLEMIVEHLSDEERSSLCSMLYTQACARFSAALCYHPEWIRKTYPQKSNLLTLLGIYTSLDFTSKKIDYKKINPAQAEKIVQQIRKSVQHYIFIDVPNSAKEQKKYKILKDTLPERIVRILEQSFNNLKNVQEIPTTSLKTDKNIYVAKYFIKNNNSHIKNEVHIRNEDGSPTIIHIDTPAQREIFACYLQDLCKNQAQLTLASSFFTESPPLIHETLINQGVFSLPGSGKILDIQAGEKSCSYFIEKQKDDILKLTIYFQQNEGDNASSSTENAQEDKPKNFAHWKIALQIDANSAKKKVTILPEESFYHYNLQVFKQEKINPAQKSDANRRYKRDSGIDVASTKSDCDFA